MSRYPGEFIQVDVSERVVVELSDLLSEYAVMIRRHTCRLRCPLGLALKIT